MLYFNVLCFLFIRSVISKFYHTKVNDQGEWVLIKVISEVSSVEYKSDSDLLSNNSGQDFSLLDELVNNQNDDEEDWGTMVKGMSFEESKLCYSTPMTKNQDYNKMDSINTLFSNSDLYKTAIDLDMDISSSCNNNFLVDDCKVYQEFLTGRNNSAIDEEDISETEETLTYVANSNAFSNDSYDANNVIDDETVIKNSSYSSIKSNDVTDTDTAHKLKSENISDFSNKSDKIIDNLSSVCLNRTLLDESDYTENLLLTQDKEL